MYYAYHTHICMYVCIYVIYTYICVCVYIFFSFVRIIHTDLQSGCTSLYQFELPSTGTEDSFLLSFKEFCNFSSYVGKLILS